MSLTPDENASGDRLLQVNDAPWDRLKNIFGLGRDGYSRGVFTGALTDFVRFAQGVVRVSASALAEIKSIADRFEAAVAAIEAGPVTSVNGQSGAVVIDLSTISAEVEAQLAELEAAQDAFSARIASTNAYSLAFGG
ncbi:hypothetical protein [Aureimonas sp. AU22]|uniref:hypothetical protein n=1 Tax=Aureimonas sp. AU22 TaxID=1638162 RepID=UPI000782F5D7|nr:hypothetical protein [Aureimonas sp. AU22]